MSEYYSTLFPAPIPPQWQPQIETICRDFAKAWEENQNPQIGDFLLRADQSIQHQLTGVLIALEVRLNMAAGVLVDPQDYQKQFSQHHQEIDFAYRNLTQDDTGSPQTPGSPDETTLDDLPKQFGGRYDIKSKIGSGGFGIVCLAMDIELERLVALKFARFSTFSSQEQLSAFIREARTVAQMDHPSIVTVYDVHRDNDLVGIVQQYIDGVDLRTEMQSGIMDFRRTATLCRNISDGIGYAHAKRFFHRDIKPANILIDRQGDPHIVDFGLAIHESKQRGTRGQKTGTPPYMPPEIVLGETHRIDGRSDIWSLGVMMYQMLTGTRPFNGETIAEIYDEIQNREPKPPRQTNPAVPTELERICLKCLSKRVVDRYTSAANLTDDLDCWLDSVVGQELVDSNSHNISQSVPARNAVHESETRKSGSFTHYDVVKIVPKGLQSFDSHDASFFLSLLPGPCDRDGYPESIRFWRKWIEENPLDENNGVGLIYGPSGCGKSSFVKAGLIPSLKESILPIYVEATSADTESRLEAALRDKVGGLRENLSLSEIVSAVRTGDNMPYGRKLLIVIDQFEQWLHGRDPEKLSGLVKALRQCDGRRIQCILMVRDDFWLATSRFMRAIEIELRESKNATLIDLFDQTHARKVLCQYGQAYGALPAQLSELTKQQKRFLKTAVEGLAEQNKVISVHLALFADMFKDKPWTPTELAKIGGPKGVGFKFLEDTFDSKSASPEHKLHAKAARKFLTALLPETGTEIRGKMLPVQQLKAISGYESQPSDFDDLIRILDQELRLVTLTDPSGTIEKATLESNAQSAHYQLTHDFLVVSLRKWLTLQQQGTRQGRAELRLAQRCSTWSSERENKYLPGAIEYANIRTLTRPSSWSKSETEMMQKAGRVHGGRVAALAAILAFVVFAFNFFVSHQKADHLMSRLLEAKTSEVPRIVSDMQYNSAVWKKLDDARDDELVSNDDRKRLHISLARLVKDKSEAEGLSKRLLESTASEAEVIIAALEPIATLDPKNEFKVRFWKTMEGDDSHAKIRAASALAHWDTNNPLWKKVSPDVAKILANQNGVELGGWAKLLSPAAPHLSPQFLDCVANGRFNTQTVMKLFLDYSADEAHAESDLLPLLNAFPPGNDLLSSVYESNSEIQSNIGVALIGLGSSHDQAWSQLKSDENLTRRSFMISRFKSAGVDPSILFSRLKSEPSSQIRAAILLSLGEYVADMKRIPKEWLQIVTELYKSDPDAFVHSSAEWLLRKMHPDLALVEVLAICDAAPVQKNWYRVGDDITMTVVPAPGKFMVSSGTADQEPKSAELTYEYFLSSKEISRAQFKKLMPDYDLDNFAFDGSDQERTRWGEHPVSNVDWHAAARFCNFLSREEGIPENQWCYEVDEDYPPEYALRGAANEKLARKLVKGWKQRTGFRLPTNSEWENACQAETILTSNAGVSSQYLGEYAWYVSSIGEDYTLRPRGLLKPNRIGIFDMHGNAFERTLTRSPTNDSKNAQYYSKGGSFSWPANEMNCSAYNKSQDNGIQAEYGFRVLRISKH